MGWDAAAAAHRGQTLLLGEGERARACVCSCYLPVLCIPGDRVARRGGCLPRAGACVCDTGAQQWARRLDWGGEDRSSRSMRRRTRQESGGRLLSCACTHPYWNAHLSIVPCRPRAACVNEIRKPAKMLRACLSLLRVFFSSVSCLIAAFHAVEQPQPAPFTPYSHIHSRDIHAPETTHQNTHRQYARHPRR